MNNYNQQLAALIHATPHLMHILCVARTANLPDWLVGAGIIRNLVWDHLHGYATPTPTPDVDVVFFDRATRWPECDERAQAALVARDPLVRWEVTNQATVHVWYETTFGRPAAPLMSSADGVGTWPETATSVAVRLEHDDALHIVAPCGLADLFEMVLRRNPRRVTVAEFRRRLHEKCISTKWPRVRVVEK